MFDSSGDGPVEDVTVVRKCTTNAQCTDKGAVAVWCGGIGVFRFHLSLVFGHVCARKSSDSSGVEVLGKFRE